MSSNKEEKQYGLILPKKQQNITQRVTNVFGDNNDSDEEDGTDWVKKVIQAEGEKNKVKKQTKLNMQKALKEDPTIFQYDEVYDDMERTREQSKVTKDEKKKPRYIENLLKAAERRKKEQEYRIERMVQKEREAEGAMYADKESFVTSAYRAKLEEFKKMEEEEKKMDRLEAIGDVQKQQDMSGFYRHLYHQTVEAPSEDHNIPNIASEDKTNSSELENLNKDTNTAAVKKEHTKKSRQYRQRVIEKDSDIDETETEQIAESKVESKAESKAETISTEKRKDIENEVESMETKIKKQKQETDGTKTEVHNESKTEDVTNSKNVEVSENCESEETVEKTNINAKAKIEAERKERSKIWEKRTIGPTFEAALQRYYARKAARLSVA